VIATLGSWCRRLLHQAKDLIDHAVKGLARVDLKGRRSPHHRLELLEIGQYLRQLVGTLAERVVGPGRETLDNDVTGRTQ
jgi:hypothetical protein